MIIKKTVKVEKPDGSGDTIDVKYEIVIRNEFEADGEAKQFALVTHDPDLAGGRREGFFCDPDKVPNNHVQVAVIAIK